MKYIVYCIFSPRQGLPHQPPTGIEGGKVELFVEGTLAAACSRVPEDCASPDVPRAMSYARVIEAFHEISTVLPMRYGHLLETKDDIVDFLRTHQEEFEAHLAKLEGCVEMGVRILLPRTRRRASTQRRPSAEPSSGAAYLAARQAAYAAKDAQRQEAEAAVAAVQRVLGQLCVQCRTDPHPAGDNGLAGLYCLISRDDVSAFREAFRHCQADSDLKLQLTGPWPPYNFVSEQHAAQVP